MMKLNGLSEAITHPGMRWLAGNLIVLFVGGAILYGRMRPPSMAGAEFHHANLAYANLQRADLGGATLLNCDLGRSDLSGAYLRGASLVNSNLAGTDLRGADLREADLRGVNLDNAILNDTDLRSAVYDRNTTWPSGFDPEALGAVPGPTVPSQAGPYASVRTRAPHTF